MRSLTVPLGSLARGRAGRVASVRWEALTTPEARRLRELGMDEGVEVELLHRSFLGGGPVACRIGRMTIALRRHVAQAVLVTD